MTNNKTHLGSNVYVHIEASMVVLTAPRTFPNAPPINEPATHSIYLEPETFLELLRFANAIGWGGVIQRAAREHRSQK